MGHPADTPTTRNPRDRSREPEHQLHGLTTRIAASYNARPNASSTTNPQSWLRCWLPGRPAPCGAPVLHGWSRTPPVSPSRPRIVPMARCESRTGSRRYQRHSQADGGPNPRHTRPARGILHRGARDGRDDIDNPDTAARRPSRQPGLSGWEQIRPFAASRSHRRCSITDPWPERQCRRDHDPERASPVSQWRRSPTMFSQGRHDCKESDRRGAEPAAPSSRQRGSEWALDDPPLEWW